MHRERRGLEGQRECRRLLGNPLPKRSGEGATQGPGSRAERLWWRDAPGLLEGPSLARVVQGTPPAGPRGFCQPVLPGRAGVQGVGRGKLSISGLWAPLEGTVAASHLADEGIACDIMTQTLPILTPSVGGKPEGALTGPLTGKYLCRCSHCRQLSLPCRLITICLERERDQQEEEGQD